MNLIVKGNTEVLGKDIPIIEGGFGEGRKAMLVKTIAEIHKTEVKEINRLINNNISEFDFGIDIIDLKTSDCEEPVLPYDILTKAEIGNAKNLYILSEQGYMALVNLMRSDKAKEIRKQIRREYFSMREVVKASTENNQNDLFANLMSASMEAVSRVLNDSMNRFQNEIKREMIDTRNIITEQEIKHIEQLKSTRELIGFKTKNTLGVATLLKTKISDLKGYTVRAKDDYHYQLAKQRLFDKYGVFKWEDMPIDRFDEIHADIDSIEDLDDLFIK